MRAFCRIAITSRSSHGYSHSIDATYYEKDSVSVGLAPPPTDDGDPQHRGGDYEDESGEPQL